MAQIPDDVYWLSSSFTEDIPNHEYNDIQSCINQIPNNGKALLKLYSNFGGLTELSLIGNRTNITIDGLNQYGLSFTGDNIVKIGERQFLKMRNITYIRGKNVILADSGANFGLYNTQSAMMKLDLSWSQYTNAYVHNSKLYGWYNQPAIEVNNSGTRIEVFNSYVKGGYRYPCIMFNDDSENRLKAKNCVLLHGSLGDNQPIQKVAGATVSTYIYNCGSTTKISDNDIGNLIVNNNNNISDLDITF